MKKIFKLFLPVLLFSIGFVSCEKDDEQTSSSKIIGTWKLVEFSYREKVNGEITDEETFKNDQDILDIIEALYWRFDEDGKVYTSGIDINQMTHRGNWEIKNDKLYSNDFEADEKEEVPLIELTSSKMVWESNEKETHEGILYEDYMKYVFSKVK